MKNFIHFFASSSLALLIFTIAAYSNPRTFIASGANAAAIQAKVDEFRTELGALNPNNGQSFRSGRREINWDGVPDNLSAPNFMPPNFFNVNSARGAVVFNDCNCGSADAFQVSSKAASGAPVRFGDTDPSYTNNFQTFSAERLFAPRFGNVTEVEFFVPGTKTPATVSGFGVVFADVDTAINTFIKMYDAQGNKIAVFSATPHNGGLTFMGFTFTEGERVAKVIIQSGNAPLAPGNIDGVNGVDVVAMDDFIYGEPRAMEFHAGDFDGDGFADPTVFRPSAQTFFVLNTGTNTVDFVQFGLNGDVPVNGDFDGDKRADIGVFRPSNGEWWYINSSDGSFGAVQFGQNGDKPVVGDYDKDGKSDVAFWRPSDGQYYIIRSSNLTFFSFPFGLNGDIPIGAAGQ